MKVENKKIKTSKGYYGLNYNLIRYTFNSITEFIQYIDKTKYNKAFVENRINKNKNLASMGSNFCFSGTNSFQEAYDLLKSGWLCGAEQITQRLKGLTKIECNEDVAKRVFDVVGFQASVPRYLQGVPTNMINQKMITQKQKVVTVVKNVGYSVRVTKERIIQESVKALQIIKKIEAQGVRCNLFIEWATIEDDVCLSCRIKIKGASEKFSIAKYAFPLAHPSMLRRILFRWLEVVPECTNKFAIGYGRPFSYLDEIANKKEIILNSYINCDVEKIKNLSDLQI